VFDPFVPQTEVFYRDCEKRDREHGQGGVEVVVDGEVGGDFRKEEEDHRRPPENGTPVPKPRRDEKGQEEDAGGQHQVPVHSHSNQLRFEKGF